MANFPINILEKYCQQVGLSRFPIQASKELDSPPLNSQLWASAYAQLLFWPASTEVSLARSAESGEAFLDELLLQKEQSLKSPVDGYLILAMERAPDRESLSTVRAIELSTRVCRKNVIWPRARALHGWRGIVNVGVLGLPAIASSSNFAAWPDLDSEASLVTSRVEELGHNRAASVDVESSQHE